MRPSHEAHSPVPRRSAARSVDCLHADQSLGSGRTFAGFPLRGGQQHEWGALEAGGVAEGTEG